LLRNLWYYLRNTANSEPAVFLTSYVRLLVFAENFIINV